MPRHSDSTLAAIKEAVDIVDVVGGYLTLHRNGPKYKALCPFHDDHSPSLEINPERQSFKCWVCNTGGDVIDIVQKLAHVEFPEALRMLAERAGISLEQDRDGRPTAAGPSKADLRAVLAWAEQLFANALGDSDPTRAYVEKRGISTESVRRFALGYAPDERDWLSHRARSAGYSTADLEAAGLVARNTETNLTRDRFRGRLIFPIRDFQGRTIGLGGRILPEIEKKWAERGHRVAKYLNSPETPLFQKRRNLYAADLAARAARSAKWVAVVEGYTDVIAAHQAGLENVVGTLGTALGDDHIRALRQLADRVILIFDGDDAGQNAADRSLELFLGHEVDVRILTLPDNLDPADFLAGRGADAFRDLVERAEDALEFAIRRAEARHETGSVDGAWQAAVWVLSILARMPARNRAGLDLKLAKALDLLGHRLSLPVADLRRELKNLRRPARATPASKAGGEPAGDPGVSEVQPPRLADLHRLDRDIVQIVLNEPTLIDKVLEKIDPDELRDEPLRVILRACIEVRHEGSWPTFPLISSRLDASARSLVAGLYQPVDPQPFSEKVRPASPETRLDADLAQFAERRRADRLHEVEAALKRLDAAISPEQYEALRLERFRLIQSATRPDTRRPSAS